MSFQVENIKRIEGDHLCQEKNSLHGIQHFSNEQSTNEKDKKARRRPFMVVVSYTFASLILGQG